MPVITSDRKEESSPESFLKSGTRRESNRYAPVSESINSFLSPTEDSSVLKSPEKSEFGNNDTPFPAFKPMLKVVAEEG